MKNVRMTLLGLIALASAAPASAQVFGQFTGAEILPVNGHLFGAYVHSSENVVGIHSQLRLSFYPGMDFGFQGGFARQDFTGGDRTTVRLAADVKFKVGQPSERLPILLAAGGNIGVETGDDFSVLTLGPSIVASRSFSTSQSSAIDPYVALGLAFKRIDVGASDDTDVSFPLRIGSEFRIAPTVRLDLELQVNAGDSFNDDFSILGGVNVPF